MENSLLKKINKINIEIEELKNEQNKKLAIEKEEIQTRIIEKNAELAGFLDEIAIPLKEAVKKVVKEQSPESIKKFLEAKTNEKIKLEQNLATIKKYRELQQYGDLLYKLTNKSIEVEEMGSNISLHDGSKKTFMIKLKEILPKAEYSILEQTFLEAQERIKGKEGIDKARFTRHFNLVISGVLEEVIQSLKEEEKDITSKRIETGIEVSQITGELSQDIEGDIAKFTKKQVDKLERINNLLSR